MAAADTLRDRLARGRAKRVSAADEAEATATAMKELGEPSSPDSPLQALRPTASAPAELFERRASSGRRRRHPPAPLELPRKATNVPARHEQILRLARPEAEAAEDRRRRRRAPPADQADLLTLGRSPRPAATHLRGTGPCACPHCSCVKLTVCTCAADRGAPAPSQSFSSSSMSSRSLRCACRCICTRCAVGPCAAAAAAARREAAVGSQRQRTREPREAEREREAGRRREKATPFVAALASTLKWTVRF